MYDESKIVAFLERLTPDDFGRVLVRLPDASPHVSNVTNHYSRVAEFMHYIRSANGPGVNHLVGILEGIFPVQGAFQMGRWERRPTKAPPIVTAPQQEIDLEKKLYKEKEGLLDRIFKEK